MSRRWLPAAGAWAVAAIAIGCGGVEGPPTTIVDADSADQIVFGLDHIITTSGVLRVRVEADTAYFYASTQRFELRQMKVIFYTTVGIESSTLTALEGTYYSNNGNMEARHDVVGLTPDGRRLTTTRLTYNRLSDQLRSTDPFVFDSPDEHLEGDGFTSDPDFMDVRATSIRGGVRNQ
jgi:LPS export ABC transporter protein LptC